jgi:hypothetical protein
MIASLAIITLVLAPWHGPSLPTATPGAVKYKLTVRGTPAQRIDLSASGLPSGWVASFCTPTLCSPFRYSMQLDGRGTGFIEFQAIRTDHSAPKHIRIMVTASGAKPLHVMM